MADSDAEKTLAEKIEDALHQQLRDSEGDFVTGWLVAVKVVTTDGSKAIWVFKDPEQAPWETLGMLKYLTVREEELTASSMYFENNDEDEENDD